MLFPGRFRHFVKPVRRFGYIIRNCLYGPDFVRRSHNIYKRNVLSDVLSNEIKATRSKYDYTLEFKILRTAEFSGPNVTLIKRLDEETITVKFNVFESYHVITNESDDVKMYPLLNIKLEKPNKPVVTIKCVYDKNKSDYDLRFIKLDNNISVNIISFNVKTKDGEFHVSEDFADQEVIIRMMKFLSDRSVGKNFFIDVLKISTNHDLKVYYEILELLKEYVDV